MKSNLVRWLLGIATLASAAGAWAQVGAAPAASAAPSMPAQAPKTAPATTPSATLSNSQTALPTSAAPTATAPTSPAAEPLLAEDPTRPERPEPNVQHTVVEDQGSKIDELKVRGQTRYIIVTPKVGTTRSYQILVNNDGHLQFEGTGGVAGATGKRVWNVLDF